MSIATPHGQAVLALAEALGLDPKTNKITFYNIEVPVHGPVEVTVKFLPTEDQIQHMAETMGQYTIVLGPKL